MSAYELGNKPDYYLSRKASGHYEVVDRNTFETFTSGSWQHCISWIASQDEESSETE